MSMHGLHPIHGLPMSNHGRILEEMEHIPEDSTARHGVNAPDREPVSPLGLSKLGDGIPDQLGASQRRGSYRGRKHSSGATSTKTGGLQTSSSGTSRPVSGRQSSLSSLGSRFSQSFRGLKNRQMSSLSDLFFSRTEDTTPSWMLKRRLSTRQSMQPEESFETGEGDPTNHGKDALDHADNVMTMRQLPKGVVDDGFKIASFNVTQLHNMSDRPVGKGCQAHIWSAVIPEGRYRGQKVALKVLRADYASTEAECESFVREAHLLARMKHRNVLTALGVSTTVDKLPCLLLSWCATDVSKAMRLKDVGGRPDVRAEVVAAWSSRERLRILRELASALEFLHSGDAIKGGVAIAHRDLKPDNFGLTDSYQLKLLDFGLAVALEKHSTDESATYELTGGTGSRRYMAPEACRDEPYGVKVDCYSWAIAAWEIWNLRGKAFAGYDLEEHTNLVVRGGQRPSVPKTWHPELVELLESGWAADQRARCTMGFAAGVLTRIENATSAGEAADPLATPSAGCCVVC